MKKKANNPEYTINPDVVLREEDQDGALLFNPDTNDVKVINNTGIFIWKSCQEPKTIDKIISELKDSFDQVPEDEIEEDAKTFLEELVNAGFIGRVKASQ